MQFNLVNNKEMLVFPCIWVHDGAVCLVVSGLMFMCTGSHRSWGLFLKPLFSVLVLFLFFCFPPTTPPLFFSLSTVITVWLVPRCSCVEAHDWVAGIASHGSVLLSGGWLITVEAPRHPSPTQLNAVVKLTRSSAFFFFFFTFNFSFSFFSLVGITFSVKK